MSSKIEKNAKKDTEVVQYNPTFLLLTLSVATFSYVGTKYYYNKYYNQNIVN